MATLFGSKPSAAGKGGATFLDGLWLVSGWAPNRVAIVAGARPGVNMENEHLEPHRRVRWAILLIRCHVPMVIAEDGNMSGDKPVRCCERS